MAKKQPTSVNPTYQSLGHAAVAGMEHLRATGGHSVVSDPRFFEMQQDYSSGQQYVGQPTPGQGPGAKKAR